MGRTNAEPDLNASVRRIDIHVRRTAQRDGDSNIALTVYCPIRQHSVEIDNCATCQYCEGLTVDANDNSAFMTCRIKDALKPERARKAHAPSETPVSQLAMTSVRELMTSDVVCVEPDLTLSSLTELFLSRNISGAPVVNAEGQPIGVVSKTDVLRETHESRGTESLEPAKFDIHGYQIDLGLGFHMERASHTTVGSIMMPLTFTLEESAPAARAAALMAYEGVHRIVVVSPKGTVVGILSALDVLTWFAQVSGYVVPKRAM